MRFGLLVSAAVAAFCLSGQAVAATYLSTQQIGNKTFNLSITTDGAQGVLATNNLLSFALSYGMYNLSGAGTAYDGGLYLVEGTPLVVEGGNLIFDRSRRGGLVLYGDQGNSGFIASSGLTDGVTYQSLNIIGTGLFTIQQPSRYILAAALPEPSTWLLMLAGFSATGAALRSRRTSAKVGAITYG